MRGALAIGAACLGYNAVSQSLAYTIRATATDRAHVLAPGNARITALLAIRSLQPDATPQGLARAQTLAQAALKQDATAVDAVATLALLAQGRRDSVKARRLFAYSDRLSLRDLRTRLGMIEDAVARGDVPGTLRNYDIALRTSQPAGAILFPVLSSAISDTVVRKQLVSLLGKRPSWGEGFVSYATTNGVDTQAAAALLSALHRQHVPIPSDATAIIVNRMFAQDQGMAAWRYYASLVDGADPRHSRDPGFDHGPDVPSAFDWRPIQDSGVTTSLQRSGAGGVFDFSISPSVGGPLLQQTQVLPPGTYLLRGNSAGISQPSASLPYWSVTCLSGRELGRITVPNSEQNGGKFGGYVTVPADCPIQQLTLVARASSEAGGVNGQIHRTAIWPVAPVE